MNFAAFKISEISDNHFEISQTGIYEASLEEVRDNMIASIELQFSQIIGELPENVDNAMIVMPLIKLMLK